MQDLTEDEIQARLAGEVVHGPRSFRGTELATLTKGLRDLAHKVVRRDDTATFHDLALLRILRDAHAPAGASDSMRLEKRRALMAATDDVVGFRAAVSLELDELEESDLIEALRLVNELLGLVEEAKVTLAEKKSDAVGEAPSPMTTP